MLYKRLSRGEMLKALADHATFYSTSHDQTLSWNEDMNCYLVGGYGANVFIDKFEEMPGTPGMIRIYRKMSFLDKEIDIMIGAITPSEWLVEIPEEGEEE